MWRLCDKRRGSKNASSSYGTGCGGEEDEDGRQCVGSCELENSRLSVRLFLDPDFDGIYSEFSFPVSVYRFAARVVIKEHTNINPVC